MNNQGLSLLLKEEQQMLLINRVYHQPPMQTEKSQPEGKRIMPETRFTSFPALSVDPSFETYVFEVKMTKF